METKEQLTQVLAQGGRIAIVEDAALDTTIALTEDTTITLTADLDASAVSNRPFEVSGNVDLTINAGNSTITVNGGTFEGITVDGQVPGGILYPNCADAPCTLR